MATKKKRKLFKTVAVVSVVYFSIALISSQMQIAEKKQQLEEVQQKCEVQRLANKEVERNLLRFEDTEYIKRAAREKLGFGEPDERLFVDIAGLK